MAIVPPEQTDEQAERRVRIHEIRALNESHVYWVISWVPPVKTEAVQHSYKLEIIKARLRVKGWIPLNNDSN